MSAQQSGNPAVAASGAPAQTAPQPKPQTPPSADSKPNEPAASRVVIGTEPAILLLDEKRQIVAARPSCAALFGQSQFELTGQRLETLLKNGAPPELEKFLLGAGTATQGEYKTTLAVTIRRKDGVELPAYLMIKRLWNHPQYCWTAAFQEQGNPADRKPPAAVTQPHTQTGQPPAAPSENSQAASPSSGEKNNPQPPASASQARANDLSVKLEQDRSMLIQRIYTSEMKLSAAQDELQEANTSLEALQREFEGVAAAKADAEQQLAELRKVQGASELERLKAELKQQSQERQKIETELRGELDAAKTAAEQHQRQSTTDLDRTKTDLQQQTQERQRFETELREHQNAAKTAAEQSATALKEKESRCAELEGELAKTQQARDEFEQQKRKAAGELDHAKTELQQLTQDRERLETELREQQNTARAAAEKNEVVLKERDSECARLEEEATRARQSRDEIEQQQRHTTAELDRTKSELQQQTQERQRVETDLREQLNSANTASEQKAIVLREKEGQCAHLEEELNRSRQSRGELEQQHRQATAELDRTKSELQQQVQERQRVEKELRGQLDSTRASADQSATALKEKEGQCDYLEEELGKVRQSRDEFEQQKRQSAAELERARAELQQRSEDRQRAETELRGQIDAAKDAADESAQALDEKEARCAQLEEEIGGLRPMCSELQQQLHQSVVDLERARTGFQTQLRERQRVEADLRERLDAATSTAELRAGDLKEKEGRCAQLEEEIAGLRPMCAELEQQLNQSIVDQERAKTEFHHQSQQRRRTETELREQLDATRAAAAQAAVDLEDRAARCNLLEEALMGVRKVRDELQQQKLDGDAELERAKAEFQRRFQERQRVEADLREQLTDARAAAEDSETSLKEKEDRCVQLEVELAKARQLWEELEHRQRQEPAELERAKSEFQRRIQEWQRVEADLRERLDAAKTASEKNESALKEKDDRHTQLENELARVRQSRDELAELQRQAPVELERVRVELQQHSQQSQRIEADLREQLAAAKTASEKNASTLKEKDDRHTQLENELARVRQSRDELAELQRQAPVELERVRVDLQQHSQQSQRIEADLREQLAASKTASERSATALKETESLYTELEAELTKVQKTRDELEQHQRKGAAELERARAELQRQTEESQRLASECRILEGVKETLNQELIRLREPQPARPAAVAAIEPQVAETPAPAVTANADAGLNEGQSFRLTAPTALEVFLAGTFTNWKQGAIPMQKSTSGNWTATVKLPPGTYNYLFIVDGKWRPDPECPTKVPNQFGGVDSVRRIA